MNAVDRTLRTFHNMEKRMPPWLKRTWTAYMVWLLIVTLGAYGLLFLVDRALTTPIHVRTGNIHRIEKTEGDFIKSYRVVQEGNDIKVSVEEQQYIGLPAPEKNR